VYGADMHRRHRSLEVQKQRVQPRQWLQESPLY
jgi:hypothetical protein